MTFQTIMAWMATLMLVAATTYNMIGEDGTFLMLCGIYSAIVVTWPPRR